MAAKNFDVYPDSESRSEKRVVRSPRGSKLSCKSWQTEACYRMLHNSLDPDVAEHPEVLIVYAGIGRAVRNSV